MGKKPFRVYVTAYYYYSLTLKIFFCSGRHKYFKVPRLYDETGQGIAWKTWERVELLESQDWLEYRGRWGGPRTDCDRPAEKLGIFLCGRSEGPPGVRSIDRHQDLACPTKN